MNRTNYKNHHRDSKYDRLELVLPKGQKELLKELCSQIEMSVTEYIRLLIQEDIRSGSSKLKEKMSGFSEEDQRTLDKWQIAEKYRCMIKDFHCSKTDGYFIRLKKGYINDITGSRIIHVDKMQDVRKTITKTHKE
ncbi:MAG: hypothetical protein ACI4D9_07995 [Lachnospiraceae bacterium]